MIIWKLENKYQHVLSMKKQNDKERDVIGYFDFIRHHEITQKSNEMPFGFPIDHNSFYTFFTR